MNVLNVAYNFNTGGVERLIIDISNELAKQNVSTYLCIINNSYTQSLLDSIDDRVVIFHLKKIGKIINWDTWNNLYILLSRIK